MSRGTITTRCSWCGRILRQGGWHPERRLRRTLYARTICPGCAAPEPPPMEGELVHAARKALADRILKRWKT